MKPMCLYPRRGRAAPTVNPIPCTSPEKDDNVSWADVVIRFLGDMVLSQVSKDTPLKSNIEATTTWFSNSYVNKHNDIVFSFWFCSLCYLARSELKKLLMYSWRPNVTNRSRGHAEIKLQLKQLLFNSLVSLKEKVSKSIISADLFAIDVRSFLSK